MGICFLLEMERAYCGASSLFIHLKKLGVDTSPYMLPLPYIFSPEEVVMYATSMLNDLRGQPPSEELEYVTRVCESLREWGNRGYIVHVRA